MSSKKRKFSDTVYHYVLALISEQGKVEYLKGTGDKELSEPCESLSKADTRGKKALVKVLEALGYPEAAIEWKHEFPLTETAWVNGKRMARYEIWSVSKVKPNDLGHFVRDEDKLPWEK